MLKDCNWPKGGHYITGTENEPIHFYLNGLLNSNKFDLLLGYFSSAAINLLSLGFATFISKGGKMRIVMNHILSEQDREMIMNAYNGNFIHDFDLTNINLLNESLDEYGKHFFECLAYLISVKRIEIKIVKPFAGRGIAHYKSGVFSDGSDFVGYNASCNFTYYGLVENIESLTAEFSWQDENAAFRTKNILNQIEAYFLEKDNGVEYLSIDEIEVIKSNIHDNFSSKDLEELLVQEEILLKRKKSIEANDKIKQIINEILNKIVMNKNPRFPYSQGPREHQTKAYENWVNNNRKGIFAMATGTGKTLTALNCVLNEYTKTNSYRVVIVVPTRILLEQWEKECLKFNFRNIIKVNSQEKWEQNIAFLNTAARMINLSYIVIVTYASLPKGKFQRYFNDIPSDAIFIADETHNLGSTIILELLPNIHFEKRIGLSATPNRQFDEIGNQAILEFYQDKPPFVFAFTLEEALRQGILCPYLYYPHVVKLTTDEMRKYEEISAELFKLGLFDEDTGLFRSTREIEIKLLERKRIIHKAINKLGIFKTILRDEFNKRKNLKYTLIYAPEGDEANFDDIDYGIENNEEKNLLNQYTKAVSDTDDSIMVKQFTANTEDRQGILEKFTNGDIDVLTSMKCLDEGVDIPRSELAIFCASTGNPRQFIQRRGRVLRNHKDKTLAIIHDLVVVPEFNENEFTKMERALVKKELERVVDFAKLAINHTDTYIVFSHILEHFGLNLYDL